MGEFDVVVAAGTLRDTSAEVAQFPHRWTSDGVSVEAVFTGAHLFHLAAAGCVLNDVFREADHGAVPSPLGRVDWGSRLTAYG